MSASEDIPKGEELYEQSHVHSVYNSIASHFSQTRYKPWPIVEQFLNTLAPGSVGVDVGCGNGKYFAVRDDLFILGSDRSDQLVEIAKHHQRHEAFVGDALHPPHPIGRFDFAISIAVLHHLSTRERRIAGVRMLMQMLKSGGEIHESQSNRKSTEHKMSNEKVAQTGQALIFVWALEQKNSRRGWDEGGEQDVLVPWVLKPPGESSRQAKDGPGKVRGRKNRKQKDNHESAQPQELQASIGKGDIVRNSTGNAAPSENDNTVTAGVSEERGQNSSNDIEQVYQRYYHLYRKGELEEDVISAGGEVVDSGYERDNWWCVARRNSE